MTRSLKAGSESCIEVFSRTVVEPSFALNISFHFFIWMLGGNFRQAHSIPLTLSSCISSWVHSQIYMYPFFIISSAYL